MNRTGVKLTFSSFGESHGEGIGCVIDGVPAGLTIDMEFLQSELDRRRPNSKRIGSTARDEADRAQILSGVFEGVSTGTPIAIFVRNSSQKSSDYENIKNIFRPGHADYSYQMKYGIRDYRGGGRTSARESIARVASGAIAKMILRELGVSVVSGVFAVGGVEAKKIDFNHAKTSPIFALDADMEKDQIDAIEDARRSHDSIGAVVKVRATGLPAGIGDPLYNKLDSRLADALMGINAVKAVEIGAGVDASKMRGSENNDQMNKSGFITNHSGGILGGVSTGADIDATVYFKPTPSIFKPQKTINLNGDEVVCEIVGRHDSCVGVRGSVVAEAMVAFVLADLILCNLGAKMEHLTTIYRN